MRKYPVISIEYSENKEAYAPGLGIIEEMGDSRGVGGMSAAAYRACAGNDRITDWFPTGKNRYCCEADRFVNGVETCVPRRV